MRRTATLIGEARKSYLGLTGPSLKSGLPSGKFANRYALAHQFIAETKGDSNSSVNCPREVDTALHCETRYCAGGFFTSSPNVIESPDVSREACGFSAIWAA